MRHDSARARVWAAGLVLLAGAAASACGSTGEAAPAGGGSGGAALYAQKCGECHGANLEGTAKGPSHLSKIYEPSHHSDESFRAAVRNGSRQHHWTFGDMPPVAGVSDAEVTAIIAFVRQQQRERGFQG